MGEKRAMRRGGLPKVLPKWGPREFRPQRTRPWISLSYEMTYDLRVSLHG